MNIHPLSENERRGLCEILYWAFIELRGMGFPERAVQASKLAYALHNLPHLMYSDDFAWEKVEGPLRYYQSVYYDSEATRGYDYLRMIAQIKNGEIVSP